MLLVPAAAPVLTSNSSISWTIHEKSPWEDVRKEPLDAPAQAGNKWMASCEHKRADAPVQVERMGMQRMISGRSRAAVEEKVQELVQFGGSLLTEVECIDGLWTAVCEERC